MVYMLTRRASCERRNPAERLRPCSVSCSLSFSSMVKNTLACDMSGDPSTEVSVSMPTRGSRSSSRISSDSSRWIRSPSRWGRPWPRFTALQRPRDLDGLEHLELVAFLDVREVLQRHAALESRLHLAHVVLEALERIDVAGVDDHVVAQH